jgi:hypothetical protein
MLNISDASCQNHFDSTAAFTSVGKQQNKSIKKVHEAAPT